MLGDLCRPPVRITANPTPGNKAILSTLILRQYKASLYCQGKRIKISGRTLQFRGFGVPTPPVAGDMRVRVGVRVRERDKRAVLVHLLLHSNLSILYPEHRNNLHIDRLSA